MPELHRRTPNLPARGTGSLPMILRPGRLAGIAMVAGVSPLPVLGLLLGRWRGRPTITVPSAPAPSTESR